MEFVLYESEIFGYLIAFFKTLFGSLITDSRNTGIQAFSGNVLIILDLKHMIEILFFKLNKTVTSSRKDYKI